MFAGSTIAGSDGSTGTETESEAAETPLLGIEDCLATDENVDENGRFRTPDALLLMKTEDELPETDEDALVEMMLDETSLEIDGINVADVADDDENSDLIEDNFSVPVLLFL